MDQEGFHGEDFDQEGFHEEGFHQEGFVPGGLFTGRASARRALFQEGFHGEDFCQEAAEGPRFYKGGTGEGTSKAFHHCRLKILGGPSDSREVALEKGLARRSTLAD